MYSYERAKCISPLRRILVHDPGGRCPRIPLFELCIHALYASMSGWLKETSSAVSELAPAPRGHMPELRPVVVGSGLGRSFYSSYMSAFTVSLACLCMQLLPNRIKRRNRSHFLSAPPMVRRLPLCLCLAASPGSNMDAGSYVPIDPGSLRDACPGQCLCGVACANLTPL